MKINLKTVAADITKYGLPAVGIFEAVANLYPSAVPAGVQAVASALITVLTALLSASKQQAVAKAVAPTAGGEPLDPPKG